MWFTESGLTGKHRPRLPRPDGRAAARPGAEDPRAATRSPTASCKATVAPNSQATTYHVEYGPDEELRRGDRRSRRPATDADPITENDRAPAGRRARTTTPAWSPPTARARRRLRDVSSCGPTQPAACRDFAPEVETPEIPDPTPTPEPVKTQGNSAQANTNGHGNDDVVHAADPPVAPPVLGKSVVVKPAGGSVKVKTPGSKRYRALAAGAQLPVGTTVDTRSGKIVLQSARNAHGRTQKGTFWGGVFQIRQRKHGKGMTDLHLRGGGFSSCGNRAGISVLAREAKGKRRVVRRLWGKDKHSRFRTHGRDSVATVRGTRWVTTDRCDGTLTRVTQGKVSVRDLHRKRSVLVSAGHAYLARHRHHPGKQPWSGAGTAWRSWWRRCWRWRWRSSPRTRTSSTASRTRRSRCASRRAAPTRRATSR